MESVEVNLNSFDFIEHLSEGVIICRHRRVAALNKRAFEILGGSSQEEVINSNIENCIDIDSREFQGLCENVQGLYQCKIKPIKGKHIGCELYITPLGEHINMIIIKNLYNLENLEEANRKLKTSEKIYKWLLGVLPEAVIIYNENFEMTYCNKAAANFMGVEDYKALVGRNFRDFIRVHPDDIEKVMDRLNILIQEEITLPFMEQRLVRRDGKHITAEVAGSSFMIDAARNIMLIIRDITERKSMEKKLRQSEEWYKKLVEQSPDALLVTRRGKFVFVNNAAARLMGSENIQKIIGKSMEEFCYHDKFKLWEEYKNSGFKKQPTSGFAEDKIMREDGTTVDIEVISAPFIYEGEESVISLARNITKRKEAEQKLKESEERYSSLIEMCPDGVFILDSEKILFTNQAGAEILNAPSIESVIGRSFMEFACPEFIPAIVGRVMNIYTNNQHEKCMIEGRMKAWDGTIKDIEVVNTDFHDKGKKLILNMVRDITERKKAEEDRRKLEEALEYDKLKTEFFSNISHELKTPLNIILGSIQLMNSIHPQENTCVIYEKFGNYIKMMKQNCYRLLRLINNLIDITRLDAGFFKINMSNQDIISVVEDITQSVAEYTKSKEITLLFDTDMEERVIAFDPDKIERVMLNLLSNAIKFNKPGGSIEVNIINNPERVSISVKDTGIGIPEDMQERIFQRFRQVEDLFTRSVEGSGIGLSLVKSLIEAQGGTISLKSIQGRGSEFIVELPAGVVKDSSASRIDDFKKHDNVERINVEFSDIYS